MTGLVETSTAPRAYRPPSWEVDVETLQTGAFYPGQTTGLDLRVDQSGNLRTEDGVLVPVPRGFIDTIVELNPHRRARRTVAGHLIVRVDAERSDTADWRFVGTVELPEESQTEKAIRLRVRTSSGRRVIALEDERHKGVIRFALGPDASRTPDGGQARDRLLAWIRSVEAERGEVKDVFWDGRTRYWLELGGERILYEGAVAPLEFNE